MDSVATTSWWASTDFPVRDTIRTAFLIDGRMTMLEMCLRFLSAHNTIHLAAWGLTPGLLLVRGRHQRAGEDGSPAQEELLSWLRNKGLSEQDRAFWQQCDELSVINVFRYVIAKGVTVRVLLWGALTFPFQAGPKQVKEALEEIGVQCVLDDSHLAISHPIASLHQKTIIIDNRYAFVGGIDLMDEGGGEMDRWDTKGHPYENLLRLKKDGRSAYNWHDVHLLSEGPIVADVAQNFQQRWNDVITRHALEGVDLLPDIPAELGTTPVKTEKIHIQVIRTIPDNMYTFAPTGGITTILEAYLKAFAQAKKIIYLENQYFWRRTFFGLETPLLGLTTDVMDELIQGLADALQRGVRVILVLPDNPNVGREFTDDGLQYLRELAPNAATSGMLQVYTLGSAMQRTEKMCYRPIYVHAKVAIVDDKWVTIGSANLNNRGMRDDAELNIALWLPAVARGLRMLLMAEHLGRVDEDVLFRIIEIMGRSDPTEQLLRMDKELHDCWNELTQSLLDPRRAMSLYAHQAHMNFEAVKSDRPLMGHLLPYIPHIQANEYGVKVDPVQGWLHQYEDKELPQPEADLVEEQR
jgi:phosphatidylserine/phosphatidylglycerophosphate/cardiolipin synthase-like enzyme